MLFYKIILCCSFKLPQLPSQLYVTSCIISMQICHLLCFSFLCDNYFSIGFTVLCFYRKSLEFEILPEVKDSVEQLKQQRYEELMHNAGHRTVSKLYSRECII